MANCRIYNVIQGDYLIRIAKYFGDSVNGIMALNPNISDPSKIYTGKLRIPDRP